VSARLGLVQASLGSWGVVPRRRSSWAKAVAMKAETTWRPLLPASPSSIGGTPFVGLIAPSMLQCFTGRSLGPRFSSSRSRLGNLQVAASNGGRDKRDRAFCGFRSPGPLRGQVIAIRIVSPRNGGKFWFFVSAGTWKQMTAYSGNAGQSGLKFFSWSTGGLSLGRNNSPP
jgi:hypothetical protein